MSSSVSAFVDRRDAAAVIGLLAPFVLLARHYWWVCDDAFISFRYARHWVAGHGLRYNLGDHPPVEGFSNFLWVVLAAAIELIGLELTRWVPVVSLVCAMVLLTLVYRFLSRRLNVGRSISFLATLTLAVFPPFAVWATSGLETMAFALAMFVTFEALTHEDGPRVLGASLGGIALCLLRTEGVAWVVLLALIALTFRVRAWRKIALSLAVVLAAFALYFSLRYSYYGLPFPNPVYTKVSFNAAVALRGFRYVATFFLTFLTPFLVLPAIVVALRARGWTMMPIVLMTCAFPAYAIVVGGDWLTMGRFLVPGFAFAVILLGVSLEAVLALAPATVRTRATLGSAVAAIIVLGLLPGWDVHLVPDAFRYQFRFRYTNPRRTEAWLWSAQKRRPLNARDGALALKRISKPGDSLVYGAIGAIGYYSELFIYDRYGLVSREVALRERREDEPLRSPGHDGEVSRGFFLPQRPTFLALASFEGGDLGGRVVEQANAWRELLSPRLWRSYVPDMVEVHDRPDTEAERVVMVLRLIEEGSDDPTAALSRPERRRARAARAEARWDAFFERARTLPGHD